MSAPGMRLVEELETGENEIRKVMWICNGNHHGITASGYPLVCAQCCHGGQVPRGLECQQCGATNSQPIPIRGVKMAQ